MEIRPVTDLRNNFTDISNLVKETNEPVFLTKDGHGDMVVMSIEKFKQYKKEDELKVQIRESKQQQKIDNKLYSSDEVFGNMIKVIEEKFNVQGKLQHKG